MMSKETSTEAPTDVPMERISNRLLDEGVLLEKIRRLKNSRSGYIGQLTKLYTEAEQVISCGSTTDGVNQ